MKLSYLLSALTFDAGSKNTQTELEPLQDLDMHLFIEDVVRGGITTIVIREIQDIQRSTAFKYPKTLTRSDYGYRHEDNQTGIAHKHCCGTLKTIIISNLFYLLCMAFYCERLLYKNILWYV